VRTVIDLGERAADLGERSLAHRLAASLRHSTVPCRLCSRPWDVHSGPELQRCCDELESIRRADARSRMTGPLVADRAERALQISRIVAGVLDAAGVTGVKARLLGFEAARQIEELGL
jgi:hypothetical protein